MLWKTLGKARFFPQSKPNRDLELNEMRDRWTDVSLRQLEKLILWIFADNPKLKRLYRESTISLDPITIQEIPSL